MIYLHYTCCDRRQSRDVAKVVRFTRRSAALLLGSLCHVSLCEPGPRKLQPCDRRTYGVSAGEED